MQTEAAAQMFRATAIFLECVVTACRYRLCLDVVSSSMLCKEQGPFQHVRRSSVLLFEYQWKYGL